MADDCGATGGVKRREFDIAKVIGLGLLLFLIIWRPAFPAAVSDRGESRLMDSVSAASQMQQAIDVSHYQGNVDWQTVAAGPTKAAYLKATQGERSIDRRFHANTRALAKTDLPHGSYHFFDPGEDAKRQARHYVRTVKEVGHSLRPVLDVETLGQLSPEKLDVKVKIWLDHVENALGCKPMIYSGRDFWISTMKQKPEGYDLWIADYGIVPKDISTTDWAMQQYSQKGKVDGVNGPLDLSHIFKPQNIRCANDAKESGDE